MSARALMASEWLRTRKRPANLVIAGAGLGMGLLLSMALCIRAWLSPGSRERLADMMVWPNVLHWAAENVAPTFAQLMAVVLIASMVGTEYALDTWKQLVPRNRSRATHLGSKFVVGAGAALLLWGLLLGVLLLPPLLTSSALGMKAVLTPLPLGNPWAQLGGALLGTLALASATLLATVATRSTIGGAVFGVALVLLVPQLARIDPALARVLMPAHLDNLMAHLSGDLNLLDQVQLQLETHVPWWLSAGVWMGYLLLPLAGAMALFGRRDLTGGTGG